MTDERAAPADDLQRLTDLVAGDATDASLEADVLAVDDADHRRSGGRIALIVVGVIVLAMALGFGGYAAWALTAPVPPPTVSWSTPAPTAPPPATLALPDDGAAAISVAGADAYLGPDAAGLWATSGPAEPQSMASVSKIVTALVILDAYPLADARDPGPTITFSKADHDLYDQYYVQGATIAPMPTGSTMSLHDALATMLIPSASNYADALASWAFGSTSGFRSAAREWLTAHGLNGTTIVEPTGLNPQNASTPADLVAIGKLAAGDPTIAAIAATSALALPETGAMANTNDLLGIDGIDGLKTGNLGYGTYALLYTAKLEVGLDEPLSITGAVLGGATRESVDQDVLALLRSIRDGFHDVPLIGAGDEVGQFTTPWGSTGRMVAAADTSIVTWSDTPIEMNVDVRDDPVYADGAEIGTITWVAGPASASVDLVVEGSLRAPTEWWRLTHPAEMAAG